MQKTILITGCSSGIGAALAHELARRGHRVYASARRPGTLAPLEAENLRRLALDVNDDASIAAAIQTIASEAGVLDLLINNAGFSQVGAVVDLTREDLRAQFETNVIAPVAMARAALPLLRAAAARNGGAVLANVGSILGHFTTPFAGAYCASKAAVHSLSDALRMELAPLGIRVVSIEPGRVRSRLGEHAAATVRLPDDSLFRSVAERIRARAQAGQLNSTPAEQFAGPVVDALLRDRPPRVIRGGKLSTFGPLLKRVLPAAMFDRGMARRFGLDRLKP
jgi:NAD(P)-dependent dehydrogenase (short-subunit alcohol dehydrogenase family)